MKILLKNAQMIDVAAGHVLGLRHVVVDGNIIAEISEALPKTAVDKEVDLAGKFLIPGLIDAHCHVMQSTTNLGLLAAQSPYYAAARCFEILEGMLMRGFTTVRDAGGADFGIARVVEDGHVNGPRVIYCGKALTATGGHGDYRSGGQYYEDPSYWVPRLSRVCNGVDAVREAVRDEVRKGAHHIKIMANGGVASPTDKITSDQYSEDEIRAVVDEAQMAGLYVMSHTYTARSIKRAIKCGVHSIEHGNLADDEALQMMKDNGCFLVPTLIIFKALKEDGVADGLAEELTSKLGDMAERGAEVVVKAHKLGIPMAFGTDLIGGLHPRQSEEFELRADLVPADALLRTATIIGAQLIRREHDLGQIAEGFEADLVAVNSNPLDDIRVLARPEENFPLIMKGGKIIKNRIAA